MKEYDCIVVGAGNAGLMCAAHLAMSGLKTLVLEKNNTPGGSATSFIRGRFEFEPSLHELAGMSKQGHSDIVDYMFEEINLPVDVCHDALLYHGIYEEDGFEFRLYEGREKIIEDIEKYVPGSKESINNLFDIIEEITEAANYTDQRHYSALKILVKYPNFLRFSFISARRAMNLLRIPKKAQKVLEVYWSYLGVPLKEMNAFHYFLVCGYYYRWGATVPKKRSFELSIGLAEKIINHGGEIYYNSPVDEFIMKRHKCIGVRVKDEIYYAKEIVSAISPTKVYQITSKVPKKNLKVDNAISYGISIFTIYLGLDINHEKLGINDYSTFIMKHDDAEEMLKNQLNSPELYIVNCLDVIAPTFESKNSTILYFSIPCDVKSFPQDLKPEDYFAYKNKIAEMYICDAEKVLKIDIRNHIEEISIATPATFARYLGTTGGSIYGYRLSSWDNIIARIMSKDNRIKHLSFCGGSVNQGLGFTSTYASGKKVAEKIIRKLKGNKTYEKESSK